MAERPKNMEELLDRIAQAAEGKEKVSFGQIVETVGAGSFGSLLLLAGILAVSPLSGVPGVPTLLGTFVLLIAAQMLFGRKQFWLPGWIARRSFAQNKLGKALRWLHSPARFVDRWLRPRLPMLVERPGMYFIALVCFVIAIAMPLMEVVPFSVTVAGAVIAIFGLAMVAKDGLLALLAFVLASLVLGVVGHKLL